MRVIEEPWQATADLRDAEAVITQARYRQHRHRLLIAIVMLGGLIVGAASYAVVSSPSGQLRDTSTLSATWSISVAQSRLFVSPRHPYGLAVGPNGDLFIIDSGRDQILRHLPSGKFHVVAGDGKRGYSGDGGPAVQAKLQLENNSGLAIARNGTVYFSDTGNGRVREVLPNGIIKTVAGGGTKTIGQGSLPALRVSFSKQFSVAGLAIAPDGELYIAAGDVYRLGPGGILHWVIGKRVFPKNWGGVYSNPAAQIDFTSPQRLAFDGNGDLLVAGGGGWGLYEMTKRGRLRFVAFFRGDGFWGSLAERPGGSVVLSERSGIFQFSPSGTIKATGPSPSAIDAPLRTPHWNSIFIGGDGVAVSGNGDIYVDTNTGNTFTSVSAILELRPSGKVVTLWRS